MCPTVSVLLPVYDARPTLARAVESCLAQRGVGLELVCVDDGSTDGSGELLEELSPRDGRIRVLHEPHRGLVGALNAGLAECRGKFVARMDTDDEMLPGRLAKQADLLEKRPDLAGVGCLVRVEPESGMTAGARRYLNWSNSLVTPADVRREIFVESPIVHPSVTLRRDMLNEVGGWRDYDGPEDYDLWLRLVFDHGLKLAKVPEVLHVWRDRPGRLTRTDPRYRPEAFLKLKCRYLVEYAVEPRGGWVLWGCGPVGKALARELTRRGWGPAAIVEVHPGRIGEEIFGAPVVPVEEAGRFEGFVHLGAVGRAGARERMRDEIGRLGLVEGEDFFFTA
jgi:glycosyltransferase involved in cell wall biosynthesis